MPQQPGTFPNATVLFTASEDIKERVLHSKLWRHLTLVLDAQLFFRLVSQHQPIYVQAHRCELGGSWAQGQQQLMTAAKSSTICFLKKTPLPCHILRASKF